MPRPRETANYVGTIIGAAIGTLIGGPAGAAVFGAGLGALGGTAANPQRAIPLAPAIAAYVAGKNLAVGAIERRAWNQVRVVFGRGSNFFYVDAAVQPKKSLYTNADALEDALYDASARRIDERLKELGWS